MTAAMIPMGLHAPVEGCHAAATAPIGSGGEISFARFNNVKWEGWGEGGKQKEGEMGGAERLASLPGEEGQL